MTQQQDRSNSEKRQGSYLPGRVRRQLTVTKGLLFCERCYQAAWPACGPLGAIVALSLLGVWPILPAWGRLPVFFGLLGLSLYYFWRDGRQVAWPSHEEAARRLDRTAAGHGGSGHPLSSYEDEIAVGKGGAETNADAGTLALWAAHKRRLETQIKSLKLSWPDLSLAKRDPWAVRVAILLTVCIGIFLNWGDARPLAGLSTLWADQKKSAGIPVVAWVAPPDYTRVPPIYLTRAQGGISGGESPTHNGVVDVISIPSGSVFFARIEHGQAPRIVEIPLDRASTSIAEKLSNLFKPSRHKPHDKKDRLKFVEVEDGVFELSLPIEEPIELQIKAGLSEIDRWQFKSIPDLKPAIGITDAPDVTKQFELEIPYVLLDDYGVLRAQTVIQRADIPDEEKIPVGDVLERMAVVNDATEANDNLDEQASEEVNVVEETEAANPTGDASLWMDRDREELDYWLRAPGVFAFDLKGLKPKRQQDVVSHDLTAHPWAGMDALVHLRAEDDLGQVGVSEERLVSLPERPFSDPLARALIDLRKHLVLHPDATKKVADMISALIAYPEVYGPPPRIYLGLRVASSRLQEVSSFAEFRQAHDMLWDIALEIEDGGRDRLAERIRELQQQLSDAIEQGRPQDEIDKIMQALQNMIGEYLAKLMEKSLDALKNGEMPPMDGQTMSDSDLQELLDAIEEMLRTGNMEGAMTALSQLMDLLENLQFAMPMNGGSGSLPFSFPGEKEMNEALSELGEIIKRQRGLMDETFRKNERQRDAQNGRRFGPEGPESPMQDRDGQGNTQRDVPGTEELQSEQESLRGSLEDSLNKLKREDDRVPQELERAERSMREAERALREGDTENAVKNQQDAIDQLREGTQSLAQRMLDERMKRMGQRSGDGKGGEARELDPLGRPTAQSGPEFGNSVEVPDKSDLQRAREILNELRRRAGERDRPEPELDYLDRLLPRF